MNTDLAAQRAIDRLNRDGFDQLSETDRILATAWLTEAAVSNSGFARFFASKRGAVAFYAPTAMQKLGANELAAITAAATAVFGPAGPARDQRTRRAQVQALEQSARQALRTLEDRFYGCSEDIDDLLDAFLNPPKRPPAGKEK